MLSLHAGGIDRHRYKDLEPGDPYYRTAAHAYRAQKSLSRDDLRALFEALAADWPRETRGRHAISEEVHLQAFELHDAGWSHQRIANELGIVEDVARRYVKRGRALRYSLWVAPFAAAVGGGAEVSIVGPDGVELTGADAEMRYWRVQAR